MAPGQLRGRAGRRPRRAVGALRAPVARPDTGQVRAAVRLSGARVSHPACMGRACLVMMHVLLPQCAGVVQGAGR